MRWLAGAGPRGRHPCVLNAPAAARAHHDRAGDDHGRDHGPDRDDPGGLIAQAGHRTAVLHGRSALPGGRRWPAGCWPVGQRRGRSGRVRRRAGDQPQDQKTPATPLVAHTEAPVALPVAPRWAVPQSARRARVEQGAGPLEGWLRRRPAAPRPHCRLPVGGEADRVADGAPHRSRHPLVRATRRPSAERPMAHRNTDCRPRRHQGTARHWCGCGESGVCVRSFENCKWYGGLPSDLEWSATPQFA
jgi:hypothetical protein